MNETLVAMKREAKALIARHDLPGFYEECARELEYSRQTFFDHPLIVRLRDDVIPFLYDDYGHGVEHSKKVAVEASAIILYQLREMDSGLARRTALLAQMAGLLHDVCRLEDDHARHGAEMAGVILADYPLELGETERIAFAIADHEAFTPRAETRDPMARLLADALYDADKFRWGPDNFATTLWKMCDYNETPVAEIVRRFPEGIAKIEEIAQTFRTPLGRTFGPEFIRLGLTVGREVYDMLKTRAAQPPA